MLTTSFGGNDRPIANPGFVNYGVYKWCSLIRAPEPLHRELDLAARWHNQPISQAERLYPARVKLFPLYRRYRTLSHRIEKYGLRDHPDNRSFNQSAKRLSIGSHKCIPVELQKDLRGGDRRSLISLLEWTVHTDPQQQHASQDGDIFFSV